VSAVGNLARARAFGFAIAAIEAEFEAETDLPPLRRRPQTAHDALLRTQNTRGGDLVLLAGTSPHPKPVPGVVVTTNEATIDRLIRGGIAVTALSTGLAIGAVLNPVGIVLLGVGGMAGWTAISGYCPLSSALGISTCPLPQQG
jgi:hypothetical protein